MIQRISMKADNAHPDGLDLSGLNPEMIAYYETAGWQAYYACDWLRVFGLMALLIESQFHIPFPSIASPAAARQMRPPTGAASRSVCAAPISRSRTLADCPPRRSRRPNCKELHR
jgi:hypothetical protein